MRKIILPTRKEIELLDITDDVAEVVRDVKSGICVIFTKHTTSAVIINENESGLRNDILDLLNKIAPVGGVYKHDKIDNNAHSHLISIILGASVTIPIENGDLVLGTWQSIFFVECDGPRNRELYVKVMEG